MAKKLGGSKKMVERHHNLEEDIVKVRSRHRRHMEQEQTLENGGFPWMVVATIWRFNALIPC